jgi:hypothetical protein
VSEELLFDDVSFDTRMEKDFNWHDEEIEEDSERILTGTMRSTIILGTNIEEDSESINQNITVEEEVNNYYSDEGITNIIEKCTYWHKIAIFL